MLPGTLLEKLPSSRRSAKLPSCDMLRTSATRLLSLPLSVVPVTRSCLGILGTGGSGMSGTFMGQSARCTMRMSSIRQAPLLSSDDRKFADQSISPASSAVSSRSPCSNSIDCVSPLSRPSSSAAPRSLRRPRSTHQSRSCLRTRRAMTARNCASLMLLTVVPAQKLMRSSTCSTVMPECRRSRSSRAAAARSRAPPLELSLNMSFSFSVCEIEKEAIATCMPNAMNSASVRSPRLSLVNTSPNTPAYIRASATSLPLMTALSSPLEYVWKAVASSFSRQSFTLEVNLGSASSPGASKSPSFARPCAVWRPWYQGRSSSQSEVCGCAVSAPKCAMPPCSWWASASACEGLSLMWNESRLTAPVACGVSSQTCSCLSTTCMIAAAMAGCSRAMVAHWTSLQHSSSPSSSATACSRMDCLRSASRLRIWPRL
mmetsp:Transcript_101206/g.294710  ORF Transcript_101206/g.294710 Transcript_101206/m.294710 type:complete len:430 (-) Transcript_101206:1363-2652(-)